MVFWIIYNLRLGLGAYSANIYRVEGPYHFFSIIKKPWNKTNKKPFQPAQEVEDLHRWWYTIPATRDN